METEANCIFCSIASGKAPCFKVYEDDLVMAFMDVFPAADGHVLIIPKAHFANLYEIPEPQIQRVASVSRCIALAIRKTLAPDGLSLVQATGAAAGQTVYHFHMHLIPRTEGQRMRVHGTEAGAKERLSELAAGFANAMQRTAS